MKAGFYAERQQGKKGLNFNMKDAPEFIPGVACAS